MSNELDEFEAGEDVTEEFDRPRHPTGMVVSVRIPPEDSDKLIDLAEESGRTVSQIARQAIRAFLASGGRRLEHREVTAATQGEFGLVVRTPSLGPATQGSPIPTAESRGKTPAELLAT